MRRLRATGLNTAIVVWEGVLHDLLFEDITLTNSTRFGVRYEDPTDYRVVFKNVFVSTGSVSDGFYSTRRPSRPGDVSVLRIAAPGHLRRPGPSAAVRDVPGRRRARRMEPFYPLDVRVCDRCLLVQLPPYVPPEDIFREYAYFSSFSDSWLEHGRRYTEAVVERFGLGSDSRVVEVASNDGYLLRHFMERGIPVLGIEPARNVAAVAIEAGASRRSSSSSDSRWPSDRGRSTVRPTWSSPTTSSPTSRTSTTSAAGLAGLLAPGGVLTIEVPHLVRLLEGNHFDTIYHEHYQYYTLLSAERVLAPRGLRVLDVEALPTHGGSLRLFVVAEDDDRPSAARVARPAGGRARGRLRPARAATATSGARSERTKRDLLAFLIEAREPGSRSSATAPRARATRS